MPTGRVQTSLPHQHADIDDERWGGESEFVCSEQLTDDNVASGLELSVRLQPHASPQTVDHERLLRLGQAELPRTSSAHDARERGSAGATRVARDQNQIRARLCHARSDSSDASFGDQLHRNRGLRRDFLEVVDKLRQIFNRVDVVVRWGRDECHAGNRVTSARDHCVHLVTWELATFAGLCALSDLDLQLTCVDEVLRRHAEARRRDLLDGAVTIGAESCGIFAAFSAIAPAAKPVHRDGERLVCLFAE
jgi:hypothetical protein